MSPIAEMGKRETPHPLRVPKPSCAGSKVTDLITEGVFAKLVEGTPEEIGMTMHPHPSLSEVVGEAAMASEGHPIHF